MAIDTVNEVIHEKYNPPDDSKRKKAVVQQSIDTPIISLRQL